MSFVQRMKGAGGERAFKVITGEPDLNELAARDDLSIGITTPHDSRSPLDDICDKYKVIARESPDSLREKDYVIVVSGKKNDI